MAPTWVNDAVDDAVATRVGWAAAASALPVEKHRNMASQIQWLKAPSSQIDLDAEIHVPHET